jgi:DNA polymerase III subunit gamma/tau
VEALALAYRPTTFDDLVGQRAVAVVLRAMVNAGKVPTGLLFAGSHGTGKTTTARILAAALNCEHAPGPCTGCVSCKAIHAGTSLDLVEIDAASNGLVDDIRALRQQVLYSVGGNARIVVLDEAHSMGTAAFNALLKTLEEPPPGTHFVLATTEAGRIPDTVASRCMPFHFQRVSPADITTRLAHICHHEHIDVEPALLHHLAERADGAVRDAIMALDQATRAEITTLEQYRTLTGDADHAPTLLHAATRGDHHALFTALHAALHRGSDPRALANALITTLRDILILHAGGTTTHQGSAADTRTELAAAIPTPRAVAALAVLWDLKTKIRIGDDDQAALEIALVMLTDKLAPPPPAAPADAAPRLSLTQMAQIRR